MPPKANPCVATRSWTPNVFSAFMPLATTLRKMPASSSGAGRASQMSASQPARRSANAITGPAIPQPTMIAVLAMVVAPVAPRRERGADAHDEEDHLEPKPGGERRRPVTRVVEGGDPPALRLP